MSPANKATSPVDLLETLLKEAAPLARMYAEQIKANAVSEVTQRRIEQLEADLHRVLSGEGAP